MENSTTMGANGIAFTQQARTAPPFYFFSFIWRAFSLSPASSIQSSRVHHFPSLSFTRERAGDHLRTQIWIICTHRLSSLIAPCTLDHLRTQGFCHLAHLYTHTLLAGWGGGGGGLSTPAQVSTVGGGGWGNGKHTRSSAPAQRCFHACGRVARRGGGWVGRRGNGKHMPAT